MRVLVDFFGDDFEVEPAGGDTFRATVNVSTSKTFFGWVFKFQGQVKIVEPKSVAAQYRKMQQDALAEITE